MSGNNTMLEKPSTDQRQNTASVAVHILPKLETNSSERIRQDGNFETILQPLYDFLPDYIPLEPYRIDARIPYHLYRQTEHKLMTSQMGIDPTDGSEVYRTLVGKMGIKEVLPQTIERPGYTVHLSTPLEDFDVATNYLSITYNTEIINSPLRNRKLKHIEERNQEENIVIHTFVDENIKHQVVLHVRDSLQQLLLPRQENKQRVLSKIPKQANLRRSMFDDETTKEFFIDDLPCMESDKREREEILRTYIETAALFLQLESFNLEYNKKGIYTNNDLETFPHKLEVGPLVIYYTGDKQNQTGIKTFAGLVIARLRYAFNIDSMAVSASSPDYRKVFNQRFGTEFQLEHEIRYRTGMSFYDEIYTTKDGVKIKVSLEREPHRPFKTQLIWGIENLGENFDDVNDIISAATQEKPQKIDFFESCIKAYSVRDYTYVVFTNRGKKEK
ncbi:MAG: hypothetical protein UR96_C0010G0020 [candidate division WS6 bacterium GW2011_GWC1_36_11]|uniref:Uncharacterized protein n=3 Tax=Candidatus Dojkabacteria TaxID=74243 RepID=A0A0G0GLR3_9BACT|nr:MAG: hypothetical protein UR96_C0010G0020 [candidate division WS6 bacterium GW2011_GWC1_36_11]KKQ12219.1 MAG: hypothetical protein US24_C0002G0005 [candidate division WS6 bacterium GW2011_GWC2_36_7]KKQ16819.1 MAG: hypothetical protein US29_C0018G0007 [candidate division WS6 bacterium GW2011_GWF1_36_8]HAM37625.1 hypothetical protein [Patescibacteria group bacterium]HAM96452.1 hypothetical protein [Patescibacteria group bacterium]